MHRLSEQLPEHRSREVSKAVLGLGAGIEEGGPGEKGAGTVVGAGRLPGATSQVSSRSPRLARLPEKARRRPQAGRAGLGAEQLRPPPGSRRPPSSACRTCATCGSLCADFSTAVWGSASASNHSPASSRRVQLAARQSRAEQRFCSEGGFIR